MLKTILAVDDSASMRTIISSVVREAGYDVIEAVDGVDALEKVRSRSDVALVLTDQNMPRLDGFGLVAKLRTLPHYDSIPILFITTEAGDDMKARGRAVRATGWLTKPFEPQTLVDVIRKLVG
jgi:two-component system chemotaxis response regulator CheY